MHRKKVPRMTLYVAKQTFISVSHLKQRAVVVRFAVNLITMARVRTPYRSQIATMQMTEKKMWG